MAVPAPVGTSAFVPTHVAVDLVDARSHDPAHEAVAEAGADFEG
jgi:hypothetical protein